jgi:hypothetical protein
MQTTTATPTRKVAALLLTALIIAAMVFAFASAIAADDAHAGTRVGSAPGSRDST